MPYFDTVDDVTRALAGYGYIADRQLATAVFVQSRLDKPLLVEGPAGVGKTELAKAVSAATGRRLLRLQCYEGQDDTKALYEWDYGKQLLYTQILREKIGQLLEDAPDLHTAIERIAQQESVFFSERFLAPRPLLEAVHSADPVVLLIDEVDRADEALEAVLLEMLADYPSAERELEILRSKKTGLPEAAAERLVHVVRGLRGLDLRKAPSISETVDWARTLAVLGTEEIAPAVLADTVSVVVKYSRDVRRALDALPSLVDPNAALADEPGHGHSHDRDHGHLHHDHGHEPDDDHDAEARAERAAKDQPGRHDDNYYGAPTPAASVGSGNRVVPAGQGSRSFGRSMARRRAL